MLHPPIARASNLKTAQKWQEGIICVFLKDRGFKLKHTIIGFILVTWPVSYVSPTVFGNRCKRTFYLIIPVNGLSFKVSTILWVCGDSQHEVLVGMAILREILKTEGSHKLRESLLSGHIQVQGRPNTVWAFSAKFFTHRSTLAVVNYHCWRRQTAWPRTKSVAIKLSCCCL